MLDLLQYIVTYLFTHVFQVLAAALVFGAIIMGIRWAIRHGLRAILILVVGSVIAGCLLIMFFGGILTSAQMARGLPGLLCTQLDFCPPGVSAAEPTPTPTPTGSSAPAPNGQYVVNSPTSDDCADLKDAPEADASLLGCIPNGTQVTVDDSVISNEFNGKKYRLHILAVGDFPSGWIHGGSAEYVGPYPALLPANRKLVLVRVQPANYSFLSLAA